MGVGVPSTSRVAEIQPTAKAPSLIPGYTLDWSQRTSRLRRHEFCAGTTGNSSGSRVLAIHGGAATMHRASSAWPLLTSYSCRRIAGNQPPTQALRQPSGRRQMNALLVAKDQPSAQTLLPYAHQWDRHHTGTTDGRRTPRQGRPERSVKPPNFSLLRRLLCNLQPLPLPSQRLSPLRRRRGHRRLRFSVDA